MKSLAVVVLSCTACAVSATQFNTWDEVRYHDVVEQALDNSCGFASLLTIVRNHYGDTRHDERSLLELYISNTNEEALADAMSKGFSLHELETVTHRLEYKTMKKLLSYDDLQKVVKVIPAIVYLEIGENRHFAVVRSADGKNVSVIDPARGNIFYSKEKFLEEWRMFSQKDTRGGIVLLIFGTPPRDKGLQRLTKTYE